MSAASPLLSVRNLSKRFPVEGALWRPSGFVDAVRDVSFDLFPSEALALVGESGSGKTTVSKMIQGLLVPTSGTILLGGRDARALSRRELSRQVQMIFQDPFASLNPKLSVGTMLGEALRISGRGEKGAALEAACSDLLRSVGLPGDVLRRYPHQFSGGQRQRLVIARALALKPRIILADEPVSALDLSIQAQILNLLADLKEGLGISYLLIAHDLSMVEKIADRVLVMESGRLVEQGDVETVFSRPQTPVTRNLLDSILRFEPS